MARLKPLAADANPDLKESMQAYLHHLGYVPNSPLVLARRPKIVKALAQMAGAVWDKESSEVRLGFKRLVAYMASRTHGCNYSMAHAADAAHRLGESDARIAAVVDYRASPLFSEAERAALDFAIAAASQPNAVTDELLERTRKHWNEGQIVEIAAAVALNGFLNRWNDTMAVPLEPEPIAFGEKHLAPHGWRVGKHAPEKS
jgi:uncharacterized peroxidase-related enzyme